MSLFEKMGQQAKKGIDIAIRTSEKMMRIERLKLDIQELKKKRNTSMKDLANIVYQQYMNNMISDPDLLKICQEIKSIQWQIDEKWTEINSIKNAQDSSGNP